MATSSGDLDVPVDRRIRWIVKTSIGKDWKELARTLGISDYHIDSIETTYTKDGPGEMCQQVFKTWTEQQSSKATISVLVDSLREIFRCNLADEIVEHVESSKRSEPAGQLQQQLKKVKLVDEPIHKEKSTSDDLGAAAKTNKADAIQRFSAEKVLNDSLCEPCRNKTFSGYDPILEHLNSDKHINNIKKNPPDVPEDWPIPSDESEKLPPVPDISIAKEAFRNKRCSVCNVDLNGYSQILQHLGGKEHKHKANKKP